MLKRLLLAAVLVSLVVASVALAAPPANTATADTTNITVTTTSKVQRFEVWYVGTDEQYHHAATVTTTPGTRTYTVPTPTDLGYGSVDVMFYDKNGTLLNVVQAYVQ